MKQNKFLKFLSHPKIITVTALVVASIAGAWVYKNVGNPPQVGTLSSETTVVNSNTPAPVEGSKVSLSFPKSGKVEAINVSIGQSVTKGETLASLSSSDAAGAISQAQGALEVAQANYNKVLNGATTEDVSVLQAAVNSAQVNLDQTTSQQNILVQNAHQNLLSSGLEAKSQNLSSTETPPTISGTYSGNTEGEIDISEYGSGSGAYFTARGLISTTGTVSTTTPQPIGNTGLFIQFADLQSSSTWVINIPNKQSSGYLANFNAYQAALSTQTQAIADATAMLNQAEANLAAGAAKARPEDVALAKAQVDSATGALQVAQASYNNDFIYAPAAGTITDIDIQPGEIAMPNQTVIGMIIQSSNN